MAERSRDRLLTPAALVFVAAVSVIVGIGLLTRHPRPDLAGSIALLGDGDLDGDERKIVLDNMLRRSAEAASDRERWAVMLATVALGDREAFAAARAAIEPLASHALSDEDRRWLDLGDPVLRNVLGAMQHEALGQRDAARGRWLQVQNQVLLTGNRYAFAGELAAAALR
ncbi:MAG: hypothetical protein H6835_09500 [Planctomycetes bacterium]|nr:hypothetical protein [Planctomycetota bacterium]